MMKELICPKRGQWFRRGTDWPRTRIGTIMLQVVGFRLLAMGHPYTAGFHTLGPIAQQLWSRSRCCLIQRGIYIDALLTLHAISHAAVYSRCC